MGEYSRPAFADCKQNRQLTDNLLNRVRGMAFIVDRVLERQGACSIRDYLDSVEPESVSAYQSCRDLWRIVHDLVEPLLGKAIADRTIEDIAAQPFVLTANHHGVDFFAQSVQGTLIFGSRRILTRERYTIPVFACGNIPLNNLTYPRGMLVYGLRGVSADKIPVKIPIFPDRLKRKMVSRVERFDLPMIERTRQRIHKMLKNGDLGGRTPGAMIDLLTEEYAADDVLSLDHYSDQAVVLNNRLWRRMFAFPGIPELVYLEMEEIAAGLLAFDLQNENSLIYLLLFDPDILQHLLNSLDGVRVCWRRDHLTRRMVDGEARKINANNCGTCFFWGIDDQGMRVPLHCSHDGEGNKKLTGLDDKGHAYEWEFSPDGLAEALAKREILPSLFTCYTVLSLARGIVCAGGYYQAEYLPQVQAGVATALELRSECRAVARKVRQVPTQIYLSGMQTVMCRGQNGTLIPAGPIETITGGGLSASDMEAINGLSVREAHIASLFETVGDLSSDADWVKNQNQVLADECGRLFPEGVVIK
jgi:hypothetical protein